MNQVGHKLPEVIQLKHGNYSDLPHAKLSELIKSTNVDNAPTQSLLSVVNGILEESVERRNGEIPHRVACLLRKVVQEIERRISTQAGHLRTQNNLFKAREEKYQSRIKVLEALASGTREKSEVSQVTDKSVQTEKTKEEEKREYDKEVIRLIKEMEDKNMEISRLKQELETMKNTYEVQCSKLESEAKDAKDAKGELKQKSEEYENMLEKLRNKVKDNEALSESRYQKWKMKENQIRNAVNFQCSSLQVNLYMGESPEFSCIQKLKLSWESIKQEAMKEQMVYVEQCNRLGVNLKPLVDVAENYQTVLAENRKLFNEVQELKGGNIRVYCRIRPFLPGLKEKQSIVEHIGDAELVVANPSKQGKEALKTFKFNKIFDPASTQGLFLYTLHFTNLNDAAEVYADIQAFIRSVLDGYNVCIFAYGQTGSGKTYTMSGPNNATGESVGVNYRALNDLFSISTSRKSTIVYDIGVQIVEIYNEQVRDFFIFVYFLDLHTLGILSHSQPNGLAVPDASMMPVKSTSDVMKLMDIGLKNRAKGSTAMNERSSRSHSVVSIHVRGLDKKSGSTLQGNLHLVDLAGSERVDRSEVTGDRLKEAQHINKSLSALGDVIFALAQKSAHVPYRNSKLTQLLQSSLGGHAKTLMLVQINSDQKSYSESLSTLKFAERVSGVELGAARSTKDGRDVRELMEQVSSLKDTILVKDEEIERLQLLKDLKNVYPSGNSEKPENASE
ncbi:kinesin-like protein KIN-14C [Abrus precatorius]|uniref:Kinesin-like protein KIN-14C n=1 Tax=Abrus precatorius TaxID=3816 RepID=A0A8B8LN96_ABRPR|nr:kinesin-like protein KIN-14C [Abrus precatorius]